VAIPIYSKRFWFQQGLSVPTNSAPVPAGKIWIIRDIDIYMNTGTSPGNVYVSIVNTGLGIYPCFYLGKVTSASKDTVQWRGRQVAYGGEAIYIDPSGSTVDVTISGYELSA
jgi:hypothetical protein